MQLIPVAVEAKAEREESRIVACRSGRRGPTQNDEAGDEDRVHVDGWLSLRVRVEWRLNADAAVEHADLYEMGTSCMIVCVANEDAMSLLAKNYIGKRRTVEGFTLPVLQAYSLVR